MSTAAVSAVVFASLVFHGGYYATAAGLIGWVVVVAAASALLLGRRPSRAAWLTAAALAALAAVSLASVAWGGLPHVAWRFAGLAVTAIAALVLGSCVSRDARIAVLDGVLVGLVGHAVVTLVLVATGSFPSDWFQGRQLEGAVGYHNALGLACAIGIPLAVWRASGPVRAPRALGAAGAVALLSVALATQSRGTLLATILAIALQASVTRSGRVIATGLLLGAVTAGLLMALRPVDEALLDASVADADVETGPLTRYVLVTAGLALAAAAATAPKTPRVLRTARARRFALRGAIATLAVVGIVGVAAVATRVDDILDRVTAAPNSASQVGGGDTRFTSISPTGRIDQWRLSLEMAGERPLGGHGVGSFAERWGRERSDMNLYVLQPHSIELEALAELGVLGALALLGVLVGTGAMLVRGIRVERAAGAAAAASVVAFLAFASIDWVFSFPSLLGIAMLLTGVAAGPGTGRPVNASLCIGVSVTLLAVLAGPAIGSWYLDRSREAEPRSLAESRRLAERARAFSPWDPEILAQQGRVAEGLGSYDRAAELYARAADLAPQPWTNRYREARALLSAGRIRESRLACRAAILGNPLEPELRRGICVGTVRD